VDDLIDGVVRLMATPDDVTGPVNLGNATETTIGELAHKIVEMTGSRARIEYRPLPVDDPMQRCPNLDKARTILGWEPKVALDQGLAKTIAYFERLISR
jgi:UDP-glucuronate decarboxylase